MKKRPDEVHLDPRSMAIETVKYLHTDRGIAYFEGGWWMHEADRMRDARKYPNVKANKETKQIEIDNTLYPTRAEWDDIQRNNKRDYL